jgi:hypothetical protein
LTAARELAKEAGVEDRMSPKHTQVLTELVRIARKAVAVSVSSCLGSLPYFLNPIQKQHYTVDEGTSDPLVQWYVRNETKQLKAWRPDFEAMSNFLVTGLSDDPDELYERMELGEAPWPIHYCFLPDEIRSVLETAGLRDVKLLGPGALARSIPREILQRLLLTPEYRKGFGECVVTDAHGRWADNGMGRHDSGSA